jgi:hypothetical protein
MVGHGLGLWVQHRVIDNAPNAGGAGGGNDGLPNGELIWM